MKLIIGLGNPGKRYKKTRHNTGWFVLEALASQIPNFKFQISNKYQLEYGKGLLDDSEVILAKPLTFMNNSGEAVKRLIGNWKLEIGNLIVVHDDLDIPLGKFKIQFGKGPREHKGVESVEKALGTKDFWRVRIGIENRLKAIGNRQQATKKISGEEYVLEEFTHEERKIIDQVIDQVIKEVVEAIIRQRLDLV